GYSQYVPGRPDFDWAVWDCSSTNLRYSLPAGGMACAPWVSGGIADCHGYHGHSDKHERYLHRLQTRLGHDDVRPRQRQSRAWCKATPGGSQSNIAAPISACDAGAGARHTGPGWRSRLGDQCLSKEKPVEKLGINDAIRVLTISSEWI